MVLVLVSHVYPALTMQVTAGFSGQDSADKKISIHDACYK